MDGLDPIAELRRSAEERARTEAERQRVREERRARLVAATQRKLITAGDRARAIAIASSQAGLRMVRATPSLTRRSLARLPSKLTLLPRLRPRAAMPVPAPTTAQPSTSSVDPSTQRELALETNERHELADREMKYGPDHVDVASMAHIIATRCAARGEDAEARRLYERALRIYEEHFGRDHPEVVSVLEDLVELHAAAGRVDEAAACAERVAEIEGRRAAAVVARASSSRRTADRATQAGSGSGRARARHTHGL